MIGIKTDQECLAMRAAGQRLAQLFATVLTDVVLPGVTTAAIDRAIEVYLADQGLVSQTKGYCGYRHVSCISINDEVVHGIPSVRRYIADEDIVTVDVCASWQGYCADMARTFLMPKASPAAKDLVCTAQRALDAGIAVALPGNTIGTISAAIQGVIETAGYCVVRDFAGHGIGKKMHEEPELLNYGVAGTGETIQPGMAFAIEPMLTVGSADVYVERDGWTVKTIGRGLAAHVEDTVIITAQGPELITRLNA